MLTIIGEAAKNIAVQMRRKHPEIPWKEAAGIYVWIMKQSF